MIIIVAKVPIIIYRNVFGNLSLINTSLYGMITLNSRATFVIANQK